MVCAIVWNERGKQRLISFMNPGNHLPEAALNVLKKNEEAAKRLAHMTTKICPLTGALNIYESTLEDMLFFSKILNNENYSYMPSLKLSSFVFG